MASEIGSGWLCGLMPDSTESRQTCISYFSFPRRESLRRRWEFLKENAIICARHGVFIFSFPRRESLRRRLEFLKENAIISAKSIQYADNFFAKLWGGQNGDSGSSVFSHDGFLIHLLKYFRIWFRFREYVCMCKNLSGIHDTAESDSARVFDDSGESDTLFCHWLLLLFKW